MNYSFPIVQLFSSRLALVSAYSFLTNQVNFSFYLIPVFPFSDSNFFIVIADTIFMVDFSTSIDKC